MNEATHSFNVNDIFPFMIYICFIFFILHQISLKDSEVSYNKKATSQLVSFNFQVLVEYLSLSIFSSF